MSQDERGLERTLAFHCAPSLSGIKPADLISWNLRDEGDDRLLRDYMKLLEKGGARLRLLSRRGTFCRLLVYRREHLAAWLAEPEVKAMLQAEGYPVEGGVEAMLGVLEQRLEDGAFPHEIGLFLGYPPADVEGFCRNEGRNYKFSGLWKVYGQVEDAIRRFRAYDRCRAALCSQLDEGRTLAQLLPAM